MPVTLPPALRSPVAPLFAALPFEKSLQTLVLSPGAAAHAGALAVVQALAEQEPFAGRPDLLAGMYLYADDLDAAHGYAQDDPTPTGSFWHAIVHRREGDFDNARYWYAKAVRHPAMSHIDLVGGGAGSGTDVAAYDPASFVKRVQRFHDAHDESDLAPALVSEQRKEWKALFEWCGGRRS